MTEPAYISRVRIERLGGPRRLAHLPAADEPVRFGVHSEVAEHYRVDRERFPPEPTTLDYVVAAAAGWLAGTFAGALEARQIDVQQDAYQVEARGEVENEDGVLVIKRIRVHYRLPVPADKRADAERAHAVHQRACPVARSIGGSVDIKTELELV
jgi:uncharacterized OsmC-like protein